MSRVRVNGEVKRWGSDLLRAGIPTLDDVDELIGAELFRRHMRANADFLAIHDRVLRKYGRTWASDPSRHWSRRWEYPFVAERVMEFAKTFAQTLAPSRGDRPLRILDAGSGITYLPHFLSDEIPGAQITCCDTNRKYAAVFSGGGRVRFIESPLQRIALPDRSVDVICCVSVLEHTSGYEQIVSEFARVLSPGGLLALTFDIGLDRKFEILPETAASLLKTIGRRFAPPAGEDWERELARMDGDEELLTTDAIRRSHPELLPWRHPILQAGYDFLTGHGWTGGFRSVAVFCLSGIAI